MPEPILSPPFDDLSPLPRSRLSSMRRAGEELFEALDAFAQAGGHPVRDVLSADPEPFTRWSHYPKGDVRDRPTGSLWFYHAHDESEGRDWDEHGHFHCFSHTDRLRPGAQPIALPENPDRQAGGLVHLVAISFDSSGVPLRLFSTNRWVTGEWMHSAPDVIPLIEQFEIRDETRFPLTSRWLAAILRLFHPQIAWALTERDRVLAERKGRDPAGFAEDQSLEVTSAAAFDLDAHLAALDRAWEAGVRRGPARAASASD